MSHWVIDASICAKLLVPEPMHERAEKLIASAKTVHAPDFIHVEVANVLWKWVRLGQLEPLEAQHRLMQAQLLGIDLRPATALVFLAMEVALATQRTVYDSMYIALARVLRVPCVTADEKLVNALAGSLYAKDVLWLGNF